MEGDTAVSLVILVKLVIPLLRAQILERDERFRAVQFRCDQNYYPHEFIESYLQIQISISAAKFFVASGMKLGNVSLSSFILVRWTLF